MMWNKSEIDVEDKTQPTETGIDSERDAFRDKGLRSGGSSGTCGTSSNKSMDLNKVLRTKRDIAIQVDMDAENSAGSSSAARIWSRESDDSCVDLKGMAKLRDLCCLLQSNVLKLKSSYNTKQQLGFVYTESEHDGLDSGIRDLERDVARLLGMLDAFDGNRAEIRCTIEAYEDYEARFRGLRQLNKRGRQCHRTNAWRRRNGPDGRGPTYRGCVLSRLLGKYLCQPCRNLYRIWATANGRG